MKRRSFLKHTGHSFAIPGLLGLMSGGTSYAQSLDSLLRLANETDRVLVLIYLEGGNDGLNTVIPLMYGTELNKVRPHVILPDNKQLKIEGTDFAFHPALADLKTLYQERRLQVVQSVGYPNQNFSHFRSTDIWMSASDADKLVTSGWSGRYLESLHPGYPEEYPNVVNPDPLAIELGHGSSLIFQGRLSNLSMVVNNPTEFYNLLENATDAAPDSRAGEKLEYVRLIAQQSQKYGAVVKKAANNIKSQKPFPENNRLAQQLKIVSRLIAGGLKTPLYMVRLGSFDTHDNQVEDMDHTQGRHANLLKTLNDAIIAFMKDLEHQGVDDRVMGMTMSEFGRRIVSNASLGTDHGSSAPMFIFGNTSKGGYLGTPPIITGKEIYQDNLPIQHDFRQVYASVVSQWLQGDSASTAATTLREFDQVPVVKGSVVASVTEQAPQVSLYPNPVIDLATIEFMAVSGLLSMDLYNHAGQKVKNVYHGRQGSGAFKQQIQLSELSTGIYILKVINDKRAFSVKLIKM
jgi:uncharacterized protein (DUF1501 family)